MSTSVMEHQCNLVYPISVDTLSWVLDTRGISWVDNMKRMMTMNIEKEKRDGILIFRLGEIYTLDDFIYFWDLAMKETPPELLEEALNAKHIIIDCTKLKGIEQTGGEIFFLQRKFEKRNKGKFLYCGLGVEQEKMLRFLSKEMTESKDIEIQNFPSLEKAIEFISSHLSEH